VRVDLAHELPALGVVVLDQGDRTGERALVAGEQALGEVGGGASRGGHGAILFARRVTPGQASYS
jgi:hypothetical protein